MGKIHGEGLTQTQGREGEKNRSMPAVWFSLKRSLQCKSEPSDVHDPTARRSQPSTRKGGKSGCSKSISDLKDVIHGSKRHLEKPTNCSSPRSIGSSEFLNPLTHEAILSNSMCELEISGFGGFREGISGGGPLRRRFKPFSLRNPPPRPKKSSHLISDREASKFGGSVVLGEKARASLERDGSSMISCHKCGELFGKWETAEAHHLSNHAVTELPEGDSSRRIIEMICRTGCLKPENNCAQIERVLKIHNMQKTLAQFEHHREMVKIKAAKLPKKHPRCTADGNELLRFYGTTMACSLGANGSSNLCAFENCCVCRIIQNGFSFDKESKGGIGVFTTSTSGRAFESIETSGKEGPSVRKALMVCRVIAGRVHRPLENVQEISSQPEFDSMAGKVGLYSNTEELYLFNPTALLPCFLVILKI